jgi:hypothetical protein
MAYGSGTRSRLLATVSRLQFSLAFIASDRRARFEFRIGGDGDRHRDPRRRADLNLGASRGLESPRLRGKCSPASAVVVPRPDHGPEPPTPRRGEARGRSRAAAPGVSRSRYWRSGREMLAAGEAAR